MATRKRPPRSPTPPETQHLYSQILDFKPSKADLRRMAILDAVIESMAAPGTEWLHSQDVGRRAKMQRSHVVYYFPNQDAMLDAAIRFVVSVGQEITVAHLATATTPEGRLEAMVRATFTWFERHPAHAAVMEAVTYLGMRDAKYRALNQKIREAGESRLEQILLSGRAKKGAGPADAKRAASAIRAVLVGALAQFFSSHKPLDYEDAFQATHAAARILAREYWT